MELGKKKKDICQEPLVSDSKMPKGKKILHEPSEDQWVIYTDQDVMPYASFILGSDVVC